MIKLRALKYAIEDIELERLRYMPQVSWGNPADFGTFLSHAFYIPWYEIKKKPRCRYGDLYAQLTNPANYHAPVMLKKGLKYKYLNRVGGGFINVNNNNTNIAGDCLKLDFGATDSVDEDIVLYYVICDEATPLIKLSRLGYLEIDGQEVPLGIAAFNFVSDNLSILNEEYTKYCAFVKRCRLQGSMIGEILGGEFADKIKYEEELNKRYRRITKGYFRCK